jgi:hypothetical protein
LQDDAPKSPKELCYPQIRHSIENVINESEKSHLSSVHSTLSANNLRSLTTIAQLYHGQLSRLIHNWSDATNDEVRWFPNYETAESKAQLFIRLFIDKAMIVSLELFEDYSLGKAMTMYLRMHIEEEAFIDALPRGRFNRYVHQWVNPSMEERRQCYLDRLTQLLTTKF